MDDLDQIRDMMAHSVSFGWCKHQPRSPPAAAPRLDAYRQPVLGGAGEGALQVGVTLAPVRPCAGEERHDGDVEFALVEHGQLVPARRRRARTPERPRPVRRAEPPCRGRDLEA